MKIAIIIAMIAFSGLFVAGISFPAADGSGPSKILLLTVLEPTGERSIGTLCKVTTDVDPIPQFGVTNNGGIILFMLSSTSTVASVNCTSQSAACIEELPVPLPVRANIVTITLIPPDCLT